MDRSDDGRAIKILLLIDDSTREALAMYVARRIRANDVMIILVDVMVERGVPEDICSDIESKMMTKSLRKLLDNVGAKTLYIEPRGPSENGYSESLNGKVRDELINGEIFYTLREARESLEQWRQHYNCSRPDRTLGYRPPVSDAV